MVTGRLIAIVAAAHGFRQSLADLNRSARFRTHGFSTAEAFLTAHADDDARARALEAKAAAFLAKPRLTGGAPERDLRGGPR